MSLVKVEIKDHVATITLNDPKKYNALSLQMGQEFSKALDDLKTNKDVRVIVLTGEGKAFSSGGHLDMLTGMCHQKPEQNKKELREFYTSFLKVRDVPQIVIAKINGAAVGAGFCLAIACDLRFATVDAKVGVNFSKIGLAPGMAGAYLLHHIAGPVLASQMLYSGKISPAHYFEGSLFHAVTDDLDEVVDNAVEDLLKSGPTALKHIKFGLQRVPTSSLQDIFDYDSEAQSECFKSGEVLEGLTALIEKREAKF